jgi:hypothetical protein
MIPCHTSWMIEGIVHGPPTDSPECCIAWKMCTRVRWARLDSLVILKNCCHSWCLRDSRVSCCQVITLQGLKLAEVTAKPSDMGATYLLQSFSSNSTFIMLYLIHQMDIDYLVVDKLINIKNCLVTIACLV